MYLNLNKKIMYSIVVLISIIFIGCDNGGTPGASSITLNFNHDTVYVEVGGPVTPSSLIINTSKTVTENSIINLSSSNNTNLTIPNSVSISEGNSSATVPLSGNIASSTSITVTASFEEASTTVNVIVQNP